MQRVRSLFKWGFDSGLIDRSVRFGPDFKRPSRRVIRKARHANGPKMFEADEIRQMIDAASPQLRAMVLLGINCGSGNSDCANLPATALDLDSGWIDYPRPKTEVPRRCPLWPETVRALQEALAKRPTPRDKQYEGLVFVTKRGLSWAKETGDNPISKETRKLLDALAAR